MQVPPSIEDIVIEEPSQDIEDGFPEYVCTAEDLDMLLDSKLKQKFQSLFYLDGEPKQESWRMFWNNETPEMHLSKFGIDFNHPTVRDAVAFDLVKLDDESVSNDSTYVFDILSEQSPFEIERFLLHRNFRIHQLNIEPETTSITYRDTGRQSDKSTVKRMYQGVVLSQTVIGFFNSIFKQCFLNQTVVKQPYEIDNLYVPFTNANDITTEVALISTTRDSFSEVTSRAYYDMKHSKYLDVLGQNGITNISSFALVDPIKDKNHIGKYLVKVQKELGNGVYGYVVARMSKEGQFLNDENGKLDIYVFASSENQILSVCESDYQQRTTTNGVWTPIEREIPMVRSTTSSHYSIFDQNIPEEDFRYVRHYVQFKTRLEGMELCLWQIDRDIHMKEVQCSYCFIQEMFALQNLFNALGRNKELIDRILQFYAYVKEYDDLMVKNIQMKKIVDSKMEVLSNLREEYNSTGNDRIDKKIELGQKISSIKLELDKSIQKAIEGIQSRIQYVIDALNELNDKIEWKSNGIELSKDEIENIRTELNSILDTQFNDALLELNETIEHNKAGLDKILDEYGIDQTSRSIESAVQDIDYNYLGVKYPPPVKMNEINMDELYGLVQETDIWNGFMFNLGYELFQLRKIRTMCSDSTIKVKRLLHNFEERIERTRNQVWDENRELKDGFDFKNIDSAGIRDIILLYDWYACNAEEKTYQEMGFEKEYQFNKWRRECNYISASIRMNEYAQILEKKKTSVEHLIDELHSRVDGYTNLKWDDKYGDEAIKQDEKEWSIDDVTKEQFNRIKMFVEAEENLRTVEQKAKEYTIDSDMMQKRTLDYLRNIGLIKTDSDFDKLVVRNRAIGFEGDTESELKKVEQSKNELNYASTRMFKQRDLLKKIIDKISQCEQRIVDLNDRNAQIVKLCSVENDRKRRNNLFLEKLKNEQTIVEIQGVIDKYRDDNLSDFSSLQRMRDEVDELQDKYNNAVENFKNNIGVNQQAINSLMIQIYNKYQDEILGEQ